MTASGVFEAIEVNVGSKVPGQIKTLGFEEGQQIKAGALLAEIDCVDLTFQRSQAQANVALAKAQKDMAVKGARDEDIRQAEAANDQAAAALEQAKNDLDRMKKLFTDGAMPRKMLDDAESRYKVVSAQKAQTSELLLKVRKITRNEELSMARSRVDAANAMLDAINRKLEDCFIKSPLDGWVLKKVFEPGELVAPASVIAVLSDLRKLRAVVYLPEAEVFKVRLGDRVTIKTDGYPGRVFGGTISFISPKAEFTPKNVQTKDERVKQMFAVKILADNPDLALKPGLPMDVEFPSAK
jgi:HlyD family secretion protein